jgi:trehalose 6-phosphate synthase/phosphatase
MTSYYDLFDFFKNKNLKMIIAADAETRTSEKKGEKVIEKVPAGGVSIGLDSIARASHAIYIARSKKPLEKSVTESRVEVSHPDGNYTLQRLFLNPEESNYYYYGFSNQTIWPLCHVTFQEPVFRKDWYESFIKVNQKFAKQIKAEINGKTFIWINDYQLSLVPKYLERPNNAIVGMFWHIPWPTWEVFRILPQKKELLESLLANDFLAFHRGYHVRNFFETVRRELEARIDEETSKVFYNGHVTTVKNLPMGIDTDIIKSLVNVDGDHGTIAGIMRKIFGVGSEKKDDMDIYFKKYKVVLGVDRLDYTKGIKLRLRAIDKFFEQHPKYIGKAIYLGIMSPSREVIPSYKALKREVEELTDEINKKYERHDWKPIHIVSKTYPRTEVVNLFKKARVCMVTSLDDGMNLVSKEFTVASSLAKDPGMLVLSQFAGSAIDLTESLIINPYNLEEVAAAIKMGLEMDSKEKIKKIKLMTDTLEEKNVYEWAKEFLTNSLSSAR